jgi:hypothetical protein
VVDHSEISFRLPKSKVDRPRQIQEQFDRPDCHQIFAARIGQIISGAKERVFT